MSVRATGRLIAGIVVVSGIADSPKMVVQSVDEEKKTVQVVWFSDDHKAQTAEFPVGALDRYEAPVAAAKGRPAGKAAAAAKPAAGRKKR